MKHWEILINENLGKLFKDNKRTVWEVRETKNKEIDLFCSEKSISKFYTLSYINNLEFEEFKENIRIGDSYFYINECLEICETWFDNSERDNMRLCADNIYKYTKETEKEVLKKVELIRDRKKLRAEMEIFARENNTEKIDWNNKKTKYYLDIDYRNKKVLFDYSYQLMNMNTVYYSSKEIVRKALEKFGERIKELYIDTEK